MSTDEVIRLCGSFAAVRDGNWVWGLGDPDLGAALVTGLYFLTAMICLVVARRAGNGVRSQKCKAPAGPCRLLTPDPLSGPGRFRWRLFSALLWCRCSALSSACGWCDAGHGRADLRPWGWGFRRRFLLSVRHRSTMSIICWGCDWGVSKSIYCWNRSGWS